MANYLINSFKRKIARRYTRDYPVRIDSFDVKEYGTVQFTNWQNPLFLNREIVIDQVNFFRRFLSEGDLAIDIGANIGHESVQISLVTGQKGLTLSFDPNPYVYDILVKNAKLNPAKTNIATYNFAITEQEGDFHYNSTEASFSNGGISVEKNNKHGKYSLKNKIKGIQLESFLERNHKDRIDRLKLIKIDTEGYDKEVIRSISNLLTKYKPAVISECFFRNTSHERFEQFNLLKSKGYSLYYFSDFNVNAEIIPILTESDMLKWKHFDLFAIVE